MKETFVITMFWLSSADSIRCNICIYAEKLCIRDTDSVAPHFKLLENQKITKCNHRITNTGSDMDK